MLSYSFSQSQKDGLFGAYDSVFLNFLCFVAIEAYYYFISNFLFESPLLSSQMLTFVCRLSLIS